MKFLCICEGGNVRSVALARTLKDNFRQDAISAGWAYNGRDLLERLGEWADFIILMQPYFLDRVPEAFRTVWKRKIRVLDVGQDRFGVPSHPELVRIVSEAAQSWYNANWQIPGGV